MRSVKKIHYKQRRIVRIKNIIITSARKGEEGYREMIAERVEEVKRRESGSGKEWEKGMSKEKNGRKEIKK